MGSSAEYLIVPDNVSFYWRWSTHTHTPCYMYPVLFWMSWFWCLVSFYPAWLTRSVARPTAAPTPHSPACEPRLETRGSVCLGWTHTCRERNTCTQSNTCTSLQWHTHTHICRVKELERLDVTGLIIEGCPLKLPHTKAQKIKLSYQWAAQATKKEEKISLLLLLTFLSQTLFYLSPSLFPCLS